MLSEKGSIQTDRISVETALGLYRKNLKIVSLVLLIAGTSGLLAYIILSTVLDVAYDKEYAWTDLFLLFAVPFTLGLIGSITISRIKRREKTESKTSSCEFFADCFFCNIENVSTLMPSSVTDKFAYSGAILKRENQKYAYLYLFGKGAVIPFSKEDLTEPELNTLRRLFRRDVSGGETVQLEKYREEEKSELS